MARSATCACSAGRDVVDERLIVGAERHRRIASGFRFAPHPKRTLLTTFVF